MKFVIHKLRYSDKEISPKQYLAFQRNYFKHLLGLNLQNNSHLIKYFSMPFFHDAILSKFEANTWKNKIILEIVREEADLCDLNNYCTRNKIPKIALSMYRREPLIYRFEFSGVENCKYSYDGEYIKDFWIMDCELDKTKHGSLLTISQDNSSEVYFNFKKSRFQLLNTSIIPKHTQGLAKRMPYCEHCNKSMMTGEQLREKLKENKS